MRSPGQRPWSLLRRNGQLRSLLTARVVSFAGDQLTAVALTLHVHGRYGVGAAVSVLLVAQALPQLAGAWAGALVDRADQRRVLRFCEAARAVVVLTIAVLLPPLPVLAALVAANAALATVLRPAGRSAIPALVDRDQLPAANAALATGANLGLALGPLLGGVLTAWVGVRGTLLVDVATSLAAPLVLRRLRPLPPQRAVTPVRFGSDVVEGLRFTWQHPASRLLALTLLGAVALAGTILVAGVFLIRDRLDGGPAGYGAFTGAWGLGMIAVSLAIAITTRHGTPSAWVTAALGAQAAALLAAGVAPILAVAIAASVMGGVGNGLQDIATDTILQHRVPRRLLGRVVGAVYSASFAGELIAYAAAGPLVDLAGPRTVLVCAGAGLTLLAVLTAPRLSASAAPPSGPST